MKTTGQAGANAMMVKVATAVAAAKTTGANGKSSKITVRYNKAATLAKIAMTALASLKDVGIRALPEPRKAPQATRVAVRYNNVATLAQVAVTAKTTARASLENVGVRALPKPRKAPKIPDRT
uniref:Uncharacterized protein n=1 Tax=Sipha flava TaxID=143950 RepID=A0A2S2QXJ6_9HEMI